MGTWYIYNWKQKNILEAVKKYAPLLENSLQEFMETMWGYLCEEVGLYGCYDDNGIYSYKDCVDYYWTDEDLQDEYETPDDYVDSLTSGYSEYFELTGNEAGPADDNYDVYLDFFYELFRGLKMGDLANEVNDMRTEEE